MGQVTSPFGHNLHDKKNLFIVTDFYSLPLLDSISNPLSFAPTAKFFHHSQSTKYTIF